MEARRLLRHIGNFVEDESCSGESLQNSSTSHLFARLVVDDEVTSFQGSHQGLLAITQLAEATFNGTLHVVVACDTNPIMFE